MSDHSPQDILLVEPSSLTGSIIVATARQLNLPTVRLVNSVRVAQQRLSHESYAGVIVSLDEQEREAVALLEQVRNDELAVSADVPVAVTTTQVDASTAVKMKALQVRRVLIKPFKATLNKSLAHRAPLLWAVCRVANPRDSYGYRCGLRLASHPKSGCAPLRGLIQRCLNLTVSQT